jgi:hypothetical protein
MAIILLLPFLAFFCWLYAEAKLGTNFRVVSGLLCIGLTGFACYFFARFVPRLESKVHRSSLRLAGEFLSTGESLRVQQAVQAYNSAATNGTTYGASLEMWRVLNHSPEK